MGTDSERSRYADLVAEVGVPFLGLRFRPDANELEVEHLTPAAIELIGPMGRVRTPFPLRHALPALAADLGRWLEEATLGDRGPDDVRAARWTDRSAVVTTEYEIRAYPLGDRRLGVTLVECLPPPHRVLERRAAHLRDTAAILRRCNPAGGATALMEALLPQLTRAWPDHVGARAWFDQRCIGTSRFQATESRLLATFETADGHRGRLEIMRQPGALQREHAVFDIEDQLLLDAFAEALRQALDHLSERRETELARASLQLALAIAKQGFWTWWPEADELELDARCSEIVGGDAVRLEGSLETLLSRLGPESREALLRELHACLDQDRGASFAVELDIVTLNGDQRRILAAGLLAEPELSGNARRIIGVFSDRSRIQRLAEDRQALIERLQQLREQISHVAHETRNVVTVISGFSELMAMSSLDQHLAEASDRILESSDRLRQALDQLDYFRKSDSGAAMVDPSETIRELSAVGDYLLGGHADLVVELDSSREILGSSQDLQRMVLKLLVAVRDACAENSRLVLRATDLDVTAPLPLLTGVLTPGRYVQVELREADGGLSPEAARAAIADWFRDPTTPRTSTGAPLLDASPTELAVALGGGLDVRTEPARGTSLLLVLPAPDVAATP